VLQAAEGTDCSIRLGIILVHGGSLSSLERILTCISVFGVASALRGSVPAVPQGGGTISPITVPRGISQSSQSASGHKICICTKQTNSVASVRKRTIPTERPPLVSEVSANFFADRGCHVVSVTNPYGRVLGFLDRSRYYFFLVAPQLYSRG
jgi:hypothetical protein